MFQIQIVTGSSVPLYRQIVDRVRQLRLSGQMPAGTALPSVRGLAEQLVINPSTVARAYQQLVADGVIEARPGRGYLILPPRNVLSQAERRRRLEDAVAELVREAAFLEYPTDEVVAAVRRQMQRYLEPSKGMRRDQP